MQIIKDNQLIDDNWTFVADDEEIGGGDITVSVNRLQKESAALLRRNGRLGVRIEPADCLDSIAAVLPNLALVELFFADFADGRLFSHAWLLRNRLNYKGEIRATGNFLPDQVYYLSRVGVNAFRPDKETELTTNLSSLKDFSVKYQASIN